MSILTEISIGEFLDKLTILQIKSERISDETGQRNIHKEMKILESTWNESGRSREPITMELRELREVNETLWEIEDKLRGKEARKEFDNEFVELARSVYLTNDRRAQIKKTINTKLDSALVEEKRYSDYKRS